MTRAGACDTPRVSAPVDVSNASDLDVARRRGVLLVPAVLATCLGVPAFALSVLLWVVAAVLARSSSGLPAGVTSLPPSGSDRAMIVAQHIGPILAGVGFLLLTWRYRNRGRAAATWLFATATILMGVASFW